MRLIIETYWQKVVEDKSAPFGTRVLPDYELKDTVSYPNSGGWTDRDEWRKTVKGKHGFSNFDEQGRAKFSLATAYGIQSYQLVSLA